MKSLTAISMTAMTFAIALIAFLTASGYLEVTTFLISYGLYALTTGGLRLIATITEPTACEVREWKVMMTVNPESEPENKGTSA